MTEQERLKNYEWDTSKYVVIQGIQQKKKQRMRNNIRRMIEDLLESYEGDPVVNILFSYAKRLSKETEMSEDEIAEFVVDFYNDLN